MEDEQREWHISLESRLALQSVLSDGEEVVDARPRSWWIRNRIYLLGTIVGSIAFLVLLGVAISGITSRFFYYTLLSGIFPILLVFALIQGYRSRYHQTWVAVTNQNIIQYDDDKTKLIIPFDNILSVTVRTNILMMMKELEIQVRPARVFNATTISRQAPFKLEYVDGLADSDRVLMERLIFERIPQAQRSGNNAAAVNNLGSSFDDFN